MFDLFESASFNLRHQKLHPERLKNHLESEQESKECSGERPVETALIQELLR